jgi:hypothetical protein
MNVQNFLNNEVLSGAFPEIGTVPEVFFTESLAQSLYLNNTFTLVIRTQKKYN